MKKTTCSVIGLILFVVLLIAIVIGQVIATKGIEVQKAGCGVLQAGISQTGNADPAVQPQTQEKCLELITTAEPLTRLFAAFYSVVATFIACVGLFVMTMFFSMLSGRR